MRFAALTLLCCSVCFAQEKPRIYITTKRILVCSWRFRRIRWNGGGAIVAGSVPQTVELINDFSKGCPEVIVTSDKNAASYVVLFDRNTAKRARSGVSGSCQKLIRSRCSSAMAICSTAAQHAALQAQLRIPVQQ